MQIGGACDSLTPTVFGELSFMKHAACGVEKSAIFSFCNAILTRSIHCCELALNAMSLQIVIEVGGEIFSSLIFL